MEHLSLAFEIADSISNLIESLLRVWILIMVINRSAQ
ncbi:hypothetical protein ALP77_102263 [Pseudomonas amygdali pv. tabaci]|nr:hypothetical protein ALQ79_102738 [Pseudomonas amygdali pv. lachrymans]RMP41766.1 hypothetical protein ALQ26_103165 [Pseudomonas amygdali pv. lachrymans]RMR82167.1 hypothetical protein ALP77_102263 [Pseudomonas amygdali pv. tabaci]RMT18096.1 hypothetical protein ALP54_102659 [Pseudomonas amygdali pv. lachrymans]